MTAAKSCGRDPISKVYLALKKKKFDVKVDKNDKLHIKDAVIERITKYHFIDGETICNDFIQIKNDTYTVKIRSYLEGWVGAIVTKNNNGVAISPEDLPKWLYDITDVATDGLLSNMR